MCLEFEKTRRCLSELQVSRIDRGLTRIEFCFSIKMPGAREFLIAPFPSFIGQTNNYFGLNLHIKQGYNFPPF